jgi:hypothetical protein
MGSNNLSICESAIGKEAFVSLDQNRGYKRGGEFHSKTLWISQKKDK